ncbi:MAG: hypothetical protein BWY26_00732 [Elusimicrobia bacterium ADurb.Bin231]|nr:MAG: hypothetical protein BWY26_00732 [Elusimicrobia bacterium ADurb.Bin231]
MEALPNIESFSDGFIVPIPTLPVDPIVIRSKLFVRILNGCPEVVPTKAKSNGPST